MSGPSTQGDGEPNYLGELVAHWRALVAAFVGLAGGGALSAYTTNLFAPPLIEAFGWSKAAFALTGTVGFLGLLVIPFGGRLADILGVRRTAAIGIATLPITYVALSFMTGSIYVYFAIFVAQAVLGATTTSAVYSRLIAENFNRARGLAFAIIISGPPTLAAIYLPALSGLIEAYGWRTAYLVVAGFSLLCGVLALLLAPRGSLGTKSGTVVAPPRRSAVKDYPFIFRSPVFWLTLSGMILCNIPQTLSHSQLALVMEDNGASAATAGLALSVFAIGVICGRMCCGLALDRIPTHIVATVTMGLPAVGFLLLASDADDTMMLFLAVALIGASQGAEADIAAFITVRFFGLKIYSSVLGIIVAAIAGSTAMGALILSVVLDLTDSYQPFLIGSAIAVIVGSLLFWLLRFWRPDRRLLAAEPDTDTEPQKR